MFMRCKAKRLYYCASNKYDFLRGRSEERGTEIDKRIMAELKRKRNL